MMISSYRQALEYLNGFDDPYLAALRDHGKQTWGLAKIRLLLERLGNPQLAYPTVHVAGTKGKGSTCAMIAQSLIESGLKTGLYTSPHLEDWRERIQVNCELIPYQDVTEVANDICRFTETIPGLSTFEVTTAMALFYFARKGVNVAVIEVGLGGRLDATTVVEPLVSVITNISLDHTQLLGNTLAEIAAEKAAIIKHRTVVVSAPQPPEAERVIVEQAAKMESSLILVGQDWHYTLDERTLSGLHITIREREGAQHTLNVKLPGDFQAENAATAYAALVELRAAGLPITDDDMQAGLAHVQWPGRFEVLQQDPLILLDSAHNPYSVGRLLTNLKAVAGSQKFIFVFGCMADKDIDSMVKELLPSAQQIIFTQAHNVRAALADELLNRARRITNDVTHTGEPATHNLTLTAIPDVQTAVRRAIANLRAGVALCVTGSLAVVGEARTYLLQTDALEKVGSGSDAQK